ncbi:T9SS type A sorting domain-containing protein [Ulvibacter antarcticus]|uniref:Putative secreted protein (Por secretion system target) n=1 Tax=Ulvibacter antarcticus TaxID=442714 RepID=A0A3L9YBU6_9FLAO|nr:T9SS type A sorting domain-containing protein [Ulvibacter antarcticus]RMA57844.1 putative secreted protein (Por secretion system target) [Ulvibacter antarcticus]
MKNFTLIGALFCTLATVFSQSRISELGINAPIIFSATSQQNLAPCSEENPNDGTYEEGFNCSSSSSILAANDLIVAADEIFTLNQITASIFANNGITDVEVRYYDDASGLPGSIIGTEVGVVPTSQTVIGANFGYDVNEIILDLAPFVFNGQSGSETKYWVELIATDGNVTPNVFWVATSSSANGEAIAQFNGSWSKPSPNLDGVYIWSGDCDILLNTNEFTSNKVTVFPNPVLDILTVQLPESISVKSASLYDVLGKNTGAKLFEGTMNTSNLVAGVYFLSVTTSEGTVTKKIIKN